MPSLVQKPLKPRQRNPDRDPRLPLHGSIHPRWGECWVDRQDLLPLGTLLAGDAGYIIYFKPLESMRVGPTPSRGGTRSSITGTEWVMLMRSATREKGMHAHRHEFALWVTPHFECDAGMNHFYTDFAAVHSLVF